MTAVQLAGDSDATGASSERELVDVAIVGFGPVGQGLALMLGRRGYRVHAFERQPSPYPLPRAVCIDHEVRRVLGAVGMEDDILAITHPSPRYKWYNANWELLLDIDWTRESISGGPDVNFVHQPTLEERLAAAACREPGVTLDMGYDVTSLEQRDDRVAITATSRDGGTERHIEARYVVGADGANSFVRKIAGIDSHDRGFEADWLVIDVLPNEDSNLDIPPAAQYCNPVRPTTIVPAGQRNGRMYRRWEFMRLPGESKESLEEIGNVWKLLEPWVQPGQAEIVRHKIYTFRSLVADVWRNGRLVLVGDAAHVMPPFMGQGMCAGLRDAANLTWKFDLIFRGVANDALLDTYTPERKPHVSDVIDMSIQLGKMICVADLQAAAERDRVFKEGRAEPPPPFPQLTGGLLSRDESGRLDASAGRAFAPTVRCARRCKGTLRSIRAAGLRRDRERVRATCATRRRATRISGAPRFAFRADRHGRRCARRRRRNVRRILRGRACERDNRTPRFQHLRKRAGARRPARSRRSPQSRLRAVSRARPGDDCSPHVAAGTETLP